jgi:hypothetical protein
MAITVIIVAIIVAIIVDYSGYYSGFYSCYYSGCYSHGTGLSIRTIRPFIIYKLHPATPFLPPHTHRRQISPPVDLCPTSAAAIADSDPAAAAAANAAAAPSESAPSESPAADPAGPAAVHGDPGHQEPAGRPAEETRTWSRDSREGSGGEAERGGEGEAAYEAALARCGPARGQYRPARAV